jgi:hypothetical protein
VKTMLQPRDAQTRRCSETDMIDAQHAWASLTYYPIQRNEPMTVLKMLCFQPQGELDRPLPHTMSDSTSKGGTRIHP